MRAVFERLSLFLRFRAVRSLGDHGVHLFHGFESDRVHQQEKPQPSGFFAGRFFIPFMAYRGVWSPSSKTRSDLLTAFTEYTNLVTTLVPVIDGQNGARMHSADAQFGMPALWNSQN